MATTQISSVKSQKKCHSIKSALTSAILEWLLICMLFVDAIISYLITKFACYYELQTPCLLCSRLDHILGNRKPKYYWDLICGKHKLEISSLVLCHAHNNLVDVQGMCETCLFSFATINKSNAETYRLLVGKLGEGSSLGLNEDPLLGDHTSSPLCSCCNEPWIPRGYSQKLMQTKIVGPETSDFDGPLSGSVGYQENLKKVERTVSVRATHRSINSGFDHLSHVGYTELNVYSDNESEVQQSDDDNDVNAQNYEINPIKDIAVRCVQTEPHIITPLPDELASEKLIDAVASPEIPISVSNIQSDFSESQEVTSVSPTVARGNGLEEFDWQQADVKSDPSVLPELISLDALLPSSISRETALEVPEDDKHSFLDDVPPSLNAIETPVEASKESTLVSAEDVPSSSSGGETPLEASEKSKLISVDDVRQLSESKATPGQISTNSKLVSPIDVLPLSSAAETPVQGLKVNCKFRISPSFLLSISPLVLVRCCIDICGCYALVTLLKFKVELLCARVYCINLFMVLKYILVIKTLQK